MLVNFYLNCLKTKDNLIKIVLGSILLTLLLFITLSGSPQQMPGANLGLYFRPQQNIEDIGVLIKAIRHSSGFPLILADVRQSLEGH